MPENLKALRGRIKSINMTKKITKAMEMVAASKLRKTEGVMKASRPFLLKIQTLLGRLAQSEIAQRNPLFQKKTAGEQVIVVFTSDRGLCGAFNANILKLAVRELKANPELKIIVLGKKGQAYFRRYYKSRILQEYVDMGGIVDGKFTDKVGGDLVDGFLNGKYKTVQLLFPRFISSSTNRPIVEQFLPLEAAAFGVQNADPTKAIDYILEPTPERVFEAILPRFLKTKIFITLAETMTSEHSSRMVAMNNATKNCTELSGRLTLRLNKARQAAITTEIIEIVSGAEALNG